MSDKEHDFRSLVCIYAQLLPVIRAAGKEMGYAIAVHGTMQRDLDLLAVPWVEDAKSPRELVEIVAKAVDGFVIGDVHDRGEVSQPTTQPHGRLSWNICWGGNPFIDLSVMPPRTNAAIREGVGFQFDERSRANLDDLVAQGRCTPEHAELIRSGVIRGEFAE